MTENSVSGITSGADPQPKNKRNWLGWGLAILILGGCFFLLDVDDVKAAVASISAFEVAIILALYTADRMLMGYKWSLLLRIAGANIPHLHAIRLFYQSSLSGIFMPSHIGGDILRAHWASKANHKTHENYASIVMERMLGLISAVNWALFGGLFCILWLKPDAALLWIGLGALALLSANALFLMSIHDSFHQIVLGLLAGKTGKLGKILNFLHRFYEAYSQFSKDRRALFYNFCLTLLEQGVQMLAFFAIAIAIGVEIGFWLFFAATAVQMFLYRIPISPDGWGVGELLAIAVFGVIGISAENAFSISFLSHVFVLIALLPGFFFLLRGSALPNEQEIQHIQEEQKEVDGACDPQGQVRSLECGDGVRLGIAKGAVR